MSPMINVGERKPENARIVTRKEWYNLEYFSIM
jgi:hypothetical protein